MTKDALRRADFRTSIVLALLALGMLLEATSYPMSASYGGVRNAWYVSPALFPLVIAGLLLLLSALLGINAVLAGGARGTFAGLGRFVRWPPAERDLRLLAIASLIAAYIYVFVPRVDFLVASGFFLFAFVAPFHLDRPVFYRRVLAGYLTVGAGVALLAAVALPETFPYSLDLVVALAWLVLAGLTWRDAAHEAELKARFTTALAVSIVVPLVLSVAFKYGLLVPLPHEGAAIELMQTVRYALRAAL